MKEYQKLLEMFQGDPLLLDMYLTKLEVSQDLFGEYRSLLIESNIQTTPLRKDWSEYDEGAFDQGYLETMTHEGLMALQTSRRKAYIKNVPSKIKEYQRLRDG